jgi:Fur family ferric uptake transcriptional regulator
MTKARRETLNVLQEANFPLSANDIVKKIAITVDPVTIYRTLKYLEERGYTDSFLLHCEDHGTQRYYTFRDKDAHHHWFHCKKCHSFIDLGSCELESILKRYQKEFGIAIADHTLNLVGLCPKCVKSN